LNDLKNPNPLDFVSVRCDFVAVASERYERLRGLLRSYGSCLVAYSGGVDSAFLAYVAHEVLGDKALAAIADSPSLPRREFEEALALSHQFRFPLRVLRTREFENTSYLANPDNRCYFCKHELFAELAPLAKAEGFAFIVYGENASDIGDYRPGAQAAAEFQVRAPLKEAGLTKADIRALSAELGLPTADKPQMACLSSRVPYGEAVSPEKLKMIEQAENLLRDLGFYDVRVRHHELRKAALPTTLDSSPRKSEATAGQPSAILHLARIEVGPAEMRNFLENGTSTKVAEALRKIGYAHVTLDLQGYRRGSTNEVLQPPVSNAG
jgi:pyridinium-3,5-biscarboxylic acid mononucleotide sulfurtransferase